MVLYFTKEKLGLSEIWGYYYRHILIFSFIIFISPLCNLNPSSFKFQLFLTPWKNMPLMKIQLLVSWMTMVKQAEHYHSQVIVHSSLKSAACYLNEMKNVKNTLWGYNSHIESFVCNETVSWLSNWTSCPSRGKFSKQNICFTFSCPAAFWMKKTESIQEITL